MLLTVLQFIAGLAAGGAWLYLVIIGKAEAGTFISTLQMLLGALITHLVYQAANNAPAVAAAPEAVKPAVAPLPITTAGPSGQQGFATPYFAIVLFAIGCAIVLTLSGCATTYAAGFNASLAQAKAVDDNVVMTEKAAMCALPLSAILRNADIIPGIKALCLPGGNASDPNGILPDPQHGPVQVQIVPQQASQGK